MITMDNSQEGQGGRKIISGGRLGNDGQYEEFPPLSGADIIKRDGSGEEAALLDEQQEDNPLPPPVKTKSDEIIEVCTDMPVADLFALISTIKVIFNQKVGAEIEQQAAVVLENERKMQTLQSLNYRMNNA